MDTESVQSENSDVSTGGNASTVSKCEKNRTKYVQLIGISTILCTFVLFFLCRDECENRVQGLRTPTTTCPWMWTSNQLKNLIN